MEIRILCDLSVVSFSTHYTLILVLNAFPSFQMRARICYAKDETADQLKDGLEICFRSDFYS